MSTFMESIKNQQQRHTENGAVGYTTTSHDLLDLNFAVPSFRRNIGIEYFRKFDNSIKEESNLTLRWLLFLRDIREGLGERASFRWFFYHLCTIEPDLAISFLNKVNIAEYGRWDDYIYVFGALSDKVEEELLIKAKIVSILDNQLNEDVVNSLHNKPVSLLAKWMPSEKASSAKTRKLAKELAKAFGVTKQEYRKTLSKLRRYLDVVEVKMSDSNWGEIEYSKVPSVANVRYMGAFFRHDNERYVDYLESIKQGKQKINANALFLYEIIHKYNISDSSYYTLECLKNMYPVNETLEQMWNAQEPPKEFANTLIVRDGSYSMCCGIDNSNVLALDVADAFTIYLSAYNSEEYKNKFITFSREAELIDISEQDTLRDKLLRIRQEDSYENTNVENVLSLVLRAMKESGKSVDRILFISDMEYDSCAFGRNDKALFEVWQDKYKEEGFTMPKLVFWNVASRTNTIPVRQNESGIILVSGFSKNIVDMVMSPKLDPYQILLDKLMDKRYNIINQVC